MGVKYIISHKKGIILHLFDVISIEIGKGGGGHFGGSTRILPKGVGGPFRLKSLFEKEYPPPSGKKI